MIRAETLTTFAPGTEQLLYPYSAEEYLLAKETTERVLRTSERAWAVYSDDRLLCYAGVVRQNLLDAPFLWLLLGRELTAVGARVFRKLAALLSVEYPITRLVVQADFSTGLRFARFCGAVPLDVFIEFAGRRFQYFEVR